jgi:hypothetical protein
MRELRANGVSFPIGSRAFEILEALVRSDGEIVTKDALMRARGRAQSSSRTAPYGFISLPSARRWARIAGCCKRSPAVVTVYSVIGRFSRIARRPTWIQLTEPGGRQLLF